MFVAISSDAATSGALFLLLFQLFPNQPEQPAEKEEQNQEKNDQKQIFHFYPLTRAGNCFIFQVWRLRPPHPPEDYPSNLDIAQTINPETTPETVLMISDCTVSRRAAGFFRRRFLLPLPNGLTSFHSVSFSPSLIVYILP